MARVVREVGDEVAVAGDDEAVDGVGGDHGAVFGPVHEVIAREGECRQDAGLAFIEDAADGAASLTFGSQLNIVDNDTEHIGAAEVTDGDVTHLTGIVAQVNGELVPSTLVTGHAVAGVAGAHA